VEGREENCGLERFDPGGGQQWDSSYYAVRDWMRREGEEHDVHIRPTDAVHCQEILW
jgi:hypothetical protein